MGTRITVGREHGQDPQEILDWLQERAFVGVECGWSYSPTSFVGSIAYIDADDPKTAIEIMLRYGDKSRTI